MVHTKAAAANIITNLACTSSLLSPPSTYLTPLTTIPPVIGLFIAIFRTLHLGARERWGIICFLCISTIPVIAACLRLVVIIISFRTSRTRGEIQRFNDILYLASEMELTTAFIAACLPAMRVFLREKREAKMRQGLRGGEGRVSDVEEREEEEYYSSDSDGDAHVDANTALWPPPHARV